MGEIRIVGPGKTRGYPYSVCKNIKHLQANHSFIRKLLMVPSKNKKKNARTKIKYTGLSNTVTLKTSQEKKVSKNTQELTQFNPRSQTKLHVRKEKIKLVTTKDIISGNHVNSIFPRWWSPG